MRLDRRSNPGPAALLALAVGVGVGAAPGAARAGDWFSHRFGELRAYHADWLAVCDDDGAGPCRAVQTAPDQGGRLTVRALADGGYLVSVWDRDMGERVREPWFAFRGGERTSVPHADGEIVEAPGGTRAINAAQTFAVSGAPAARLVERMKAGSAVTIGFGGGETTHSLRGVTAALRAIDARRGIVLAPSAVAAASPMAPDAPLAGRIAGWEPEGEGLSGRDGVMVALGGRWRSLDDPASEIAIDPWGPDGPVHAWARDGVAEAPEPIGFGNGCEGPMAGSGPGYLALGASDPLCYAIERLTDRYLEMTFLGARLHAHRFERVSHDPGLRPAAAQPTPDEAGSCVALGASRSTAWDAPLDVGFTNRTNDVLTVSWIDYDGARQPYGTLEPAETFRQRTFATHPWEFTDASGACVAIVLPDRGGDYDVR